MTKITVVGLAPYPVPLSTGRHIAPGEVAQVERDSFVDSGIDAGKLGLVEIPEPVKTTSKKSETPTTSQETD